MIRSLREARWRVVTNNAKNVANEINTTSMDIDMQRTTKEYFTQIEELAELLNELTRAYIAVALIDLDKMQEAATRAADRDREAARAIQNEHFIDPMMGPTPVAH